MYMDIREQYPLFVLDFNEIWNFFDRFSKIFFKYEILWKAVQWQQNFSMRTDGRREEEETDRHDEANSRFSQFCERT